MDSDGFRRNSGIPVNSCGFRRNLWRNKKYCRQSCLLPFFYLGSGFGGGWSCFPDEKRVPTSITWVIFIVILTDWLIAMSLLNFSHPLMFHFVFRYRIAMTAVLDCLWPTGMDWYFRSPLRAKFLYTTSSKNPPAPVKISLYRLGTTFVMFGYLLARVIKREDDRFMSITELIAGGLGIWYVFVSGASCLMIMLKCPKALSGRVGRSRITRE